MDNIEMNDFQRSHCKKVLKKIMEDKLAQSFIQKLDSSQLEKYDEIIQNKTCLEDVYQNLDLLKIKTLEDFKNDTLLVFQNCIKYWSFMRGKQNEYVLIAETLKDNFMKLYEKIPASSEEDWLIKVQKTAKKLTETRDAFAKELTKKLAENIQK